MPPKVGNGADTELDDPALLIDEKDEDPPAPSDPAPSEDRPAPAPERQEEEVTVGEIEVELADDPNKVDDETALGVEQETTVDDRQRYSEDVRKRIGREQRIARDARARAETERQARIKAETGAREREKVALEATEEALKLQIEATTTALKAAKEGGKTDDEIKLTTSIARIQGRLDTIAQAKENLKAEEEKAKRTAEGPNPLAEGWKSRNPWYGNPRFAEQTLITNAIDRVLAGEGYDKNDPEYFAELSRRLLRRMPEFRRYLNQRAGAQPGHRGAPAARQPVAPVQRASAAAPGTRPGKVVLTKADFATMRTFGLDPTDPAQQKEFARNKVTGGNNG